MATEVGSVLQGDPRRPRSPGGPTNAGVVLVDRPQMQPPDLRLRGPNIRDGDSAIIKKNSVTPVDGSVPSYDETSRTCSQNAWKTSHMLGLYEIYTLTLTTNSNQMWANFCIHGTY